jgi:tRNA U34 2-thiouridine synthase MnmA/TrmU
MEASGLGTKPFSNQPDTSSGICHEDEIKVTGISMEEAQQPQTDVFNPRGGTLGGHRGGMGISKKSRSHLSSKFIHETFGVKRGTSMVEIRGICVVRWLAI